MVVVGCGRVNFDLLDDASTPFEIGCADGEREGILDDPLAAACSATWTGGLDLRQPRSGVACGDDLGACTQAADACASGWHICADSGLLAELERIGATACANAGAGAWIAASSHCGTNMSTPTCPYLTPPTRYGCYRNNFCAEPLCCGQSCRRDQFCRDAVFGNAAMIAGDTSAGCGGVTPNAMVPISGFLCCKD